MVVEELWQELKNSQFRPQEFELHFGDDGDLSAIEIENAAIKACLRGFVDRVDLWKEGERHYFRVVDYKTGKKDVDYCDILNGIGLQMLLYMFALQQSDYGIASGVLYVPARAPMLSADGHLTKEEAEKARIKEWKRKGLLLADTEVLQAMEPDDPENPKKPSRFTNDTADHKQMKLLRQYVFGLLTQWFLWC